MLAIADTKVVIEWFRKVQELTKDDQTKTLAGLARYAGVTPQAVNGWVKTGRISKTNLSKATAYFNVLSPFVAELLEVEAPEITASVEAAKTNYEFIERLDAQESPPVYRDPAGWPFPSIDRRRFDALTFEERTEIQGVVRARIETFEQQRREMESWRRTAGTDNPMHKK